jgi:benzoylformate decarboxylase
VPITTGRRAFLELLVQEGVTRIFGNPGTTELPLMDALAAEERIAYVLCLQEAAALAMADGHARAAGALAAVSLHAAPGLGNAMGMLYNAHKAGTPLLVTAGQQAASFGITEPMLWADLPPVARPFVKWAVEVPSVRDLPRVIHRAAKVALAPPTGPVFVSLPTDVLEGEAEIELGRPTRVAPALQGDREAVALAARVLAEAERPVVIAGDAVARADAQAELVRVVEALGAPVYLEGEPSCNAFPTRHPLFGGTIARLAPAIRAVLERHDVLLSAGGDLFTLTLPSELDPVPPDLRIVHLDDDPWQLGKNVHAAPAIQGEPKATLAELAGALDAVTTPAQRARAARRGEEVRARTRAELAQLEARARDAFEASPVLPLALNHAIARHLPPDAIVVEEAISSTDGLRRFLRNDAADAFYGIRGGGIGWGIPAAIGVALARPERPVVALIGDGSAMYTCQALWTAAHLGVEVVLVIYANRGYRILKQRLHAVGGAAAQRDRFVGMDLADPPIDYVRLAGSMGIAAERVDSVAAFTEAFRAALAAPGPRLLEVEVDGAFKPL